MPSLIIISCLLTVYLIAIFVFRDQFIFWTDVVIKSIMSSNFNGSEVATVANLSAQAVPGKLS